MGNSKVFGVISLLISGYFVFRGVQYLNLGKEGFGWMFIAVGGIGGAYKIYQLLQGTDESVEEPNFMEDDADDSDEKLNLK